MSNISLHIDTGLQNPRRFASLRGGTTKQTRNEVTAKDEVSTVDETTPLDCFVPRNDAKRQTCLSKLCKTFQTLQS